MDLLPTPEQDEIVTSVRSVLADRHTLGEPLDDALWASAAEQGWFGLGVPEAQGGVGYSLVEEVLVFRELGRAGAPGPFLATVLAAHLAAGAEGTDAAAAAAAILAGESRVALVDRYDGEHLALLDGAHATLAFVAGDAPRLVRTADLGTVVEISGLDVLVPVGLVRADVVAAAPSVAVAADPQGIGRRAALLTAAYLAGVAEAVTEQSVAYGKDREQFGQPIGGFQAVKHRCADMATRAEVAVCEVFYAALAERDGRPDAGFHVHAARAVAARAAVENSQVNVQNHGGIGFTWEHTAHRYVTRARVLSNLWGSTADHLSALLDQPAAG